jgi:hypothetical protein
MNNTPFNGKYVYPLYTFSRVSNITVRNPAAGFVVPESDDADERAPVSAPSEEVGSFVLSSEHLVFYASFFP